MRIDFKSEKAKALQARIWALRKVREHVAKAAPDSVVTPWMEYNK